MHQLSEIDISFLLKLATFSLFINIKVALSYHNTHHYGKFFIFKVVDGLHACMNYIASWNSMHVARNVCHNLPRRWICWLFHLLYLLWGWFFGRRTPLWILFDLRNVMVDAHIITSCKSAQNVVGLHLVPKVLKHQVIAQVWANVHLPSIQLCHTQMLM